MRDVAKLAKMLRILLEIVAFMCGLQFVSTWYVYGTPFPKDDTDPTDGRSSMTLLTDYGTGCQYLRAGFGLTPRMGVDGKQRGCK